MSCVGVEIFIAALSGHRTLLQTVLDPQWDAVYGSSSNKTTFGSW